MPQHTAVLASGNAGKLAELKSLFANCQFKLTLQSDYNVSSADETACTFVENALIKARHASKETGLAAIADDSGLCVNVLGGQPGIYSARFAGRDTPYPEKMRQLNDAISQSGKTDRSAYYYCVLVFLQHAEDPAPLIAEGRWHGEIIQQPRGEYGFGYDPVFYVPELDKTAAQLQDKNSISHRAIAAAQLKQLFQQAGMA